MAGSKVTESTKTPFSGTGDVSLFNSGSVGRTFAGIGLAKAAIDRAFQNEHGMK